MTTSLPKMTQFELLNATLDNVLREYGLLSLLPDDMQDLTQGGCLLVAASLMQQSMYALKGESSFDWFPESQIAAVYIDGQPQHFTTQFHLQGKRLYACGYGITNESHLKEAVLSDSNCREDSLVDIIPMTYREAKEVALGSEIPVPTDAIRTLYAKGIDDALSNTPKSAVYMKCDSMQLSVSKGMVYQSAADPMRLIRSEHQESLRAGVAPFKENNKFILTLGVRTRNSITAEDDHSAHSTCFTINENCELSVLNCYQVSPSGKVQKLNRHDIEMELTDTVRASPDELVTEVTLTSNSYRASP